MGDIPPSPPRPSTKPSLPTAATAEANIPHVPLSAISVLPSSPEVTIQGIGTAFPENTITASDFEAYALSIYPPTPALQKTLQINRQTGINTRSTIIPLAHPHLSGPEPEPIEASTSLFLTLGVDLAARAARSALSDWGGKAEEITHLLCVTVCCSSNPGFDAYLSTALGLPPTVERTLLHGLGCAGGVALLRHGAQLVLASSAMGRKANVLCVSCETPSLFYRHALEGVARTGKPAVGVSLFGDGAGAVVVSTSPSAGPGSLLGGKKGMYTIKAYTSLLLPESTDDLAVPLSSTGYDALLSRRVPSLTSASVPPILSALLQATEKGSEPRELDWALHPGGAAVLRAVQATMSLPRERVRASWEVYAERGNCASATVLAVLERMRSWGAQTGGSARDGDGEEEGRGEDEDAEGGRREEVVAAAFGPGVTVEMMLLRRA